MLLLWAAGIGGITSIVAIVLGIIALSQIKAGNGDGRGLAIAGIICGAIVVLLMLVAIAFFAVAQQQGNMNKFQWPPDGPAERLEEAPAEDAGPELNIENLQTEGLIPVDPGENSSLNAPVTTPETPVDNPPSPPGN
jgi:hypothetical protein